MFQRKLFPVSLFLSFLINALAFGYLLKFKPVKLKKQSVLNLSFEAEKPEIGKQKSEKGKGNGKSKGKVPGLQEKRTLKVSRGGNEKEIVRKSSLNLPAKKLKKRLRKEQFYRREKAKKSKLSEKPQVVNRAEQKIKEAFPQPLQGSETKKTLAPINSQLRKRKEESLKGSAENRVQRVQESAGSSAIKSNPKPVGGSERAKEETTQKKPSGKRKTSRENYLKLLLAEVEKNKFYPFIARKMGIEGKVRLKVVIGRRGELLSVKVLSSDSSFLEKAAVKTLKKCLFPPPPGGKFETELTIRYKLN